MKRRLVVTYASNRFTIPDGDPRIFKEWIKENFIETRNWGNEVDGIEIYGFEVGCKEDFMAAKLRWE